ncbi:hypothetical protein JTE90_008167 [Oedothorax gibbosus]|uniref:Uncharacterized protein n=1 Tax=Oedothorax gibbosus TaxID=931172 RepID=A0AAV6VE70_9ARAC|nr:hypothetical protein JTE90_008167 [Oedothorax gibbosus]
MEHDPPQKTDKDDMPARHQASAYGTGFVGERSVLFMITERIQEMITPLPPRIAAQNAEYEGADIFNDYTESIKQIVSACLKEGHRLPGSKEGGIIS